MIVFGNMLHPNKKIPEPHRCGPGQKAYAAFLVERVSEETIQADRLMPS